MKIDWQKRGLIYCPDGSGYFKTHATRPIPYRLNEHTLRLFLSSRNSDDTMLPTFVDVDIRDPGRVIRVGDQPLIELGSPGTLDDSGVTPTSIIELKNQIHLYYTGWKRRRVVSFELAIGVFIWDRPTDRYWRRFKGPVLAQDKNHPLFAAAPFVSAQDGKFKMWYCSGTDWKFPNNNPEPIYTVFYAESDDGANWRPYANPVIPYKFDGEVVSAPWVQRVRDKYLMWYSTRGYASRAEKNYTIGFAVSDDGISWQRLDDLAGISRSDSGWDSEMICYPSLYPYNDIIYMFYSGNHVGRGGIGYAVAKNFL
jgi:hypothetical protein